ncbi:hypothetical protein [Agarivorans sp. 1_MG-2023]|uniref:hypothetical protein n=1 Tax=Agarivorans sp. 1_MG-2023 TaxID=3062634 RepID=UPI0026E43879|nr:hypothetical protein [Agarivorans sp. 1_MG-2023]MDO6764848.1 hypothetical protein [Agarivorans sp. 1_MG-2023]
MLKKETLLAVVGVVFLCFFAFGFWVALNFFVESITEADPKVSAAILGAMATIFVGLAAVIITQWQTSVRDREEAHRAKKVEIYQKYLEMISAVLSGVNEKVSKKAPSEQELIDYLLAFKTDILLWGSPEVIKRQLEFQSASERGGDVFLAVNKMHKAIRKDIGLSNRGLNNLELVKMYLSSPQELDDLRASNKADNS